MPMLALVYRLLLYATAGIGIQAFLYANAGIGIQAFLYANVGIGIQASLIYAMPHKRQLVGGACSSVVILGSV